MPTPAQMCCAAGICCDPGSAEQQTAMAEIEKEFEDSKLDLKKTIHGLSKMVGKGSTPAKPAIEGL